MLCLGSKEPGTSLPATSFVGCDLVGMGECPADVVQTFEQCLLTELVNLKVQDAFVRRRHGLCRQIHTQDIVFSGLCFSYQPSHSRFVKGDWQNTVVKAVVVEDVGEAGSNNAAETILANSPRGMFAR